MSWGSNESSCNQITIEDITQDSDNLTTCEIHWNHVGETATTSGQSVINGVSSSTDAKVIRNMNRNLIYEKDNPKLNALTKNKAVCETDSPNTRTKMSKTNTLLFTKINHNLSPQKDGQVDQITNENLPAAMQTIKCQPRNCKRNSDVHQAAHDNDDWLTIQKINANLTAEILHMYRVMSHMDMEDSVERLKRLNTMELYTEMINCVKRNLAKVIEKKCNCVTPGSWDPFNEGLFQTGAHPMYVPDDVAEETLEVIKNIEEDYSNDRHSMWNHSIDEDHNFVLNDNQCKDLNESLKKSEDDYEAHTDTVQNYIELDSEYDHQTLVTRQSQNEELNIHYELYDQLEQDYNLLVQQIREGSEEIRMQTNLIDHLREEIGEKDAHVEELEHKVVLLNDECEKLRETLESMKKERNYNSTLMEGMKGENDELMSTLETYVEQSGKAKNAIESMYKELQRMISELDDKNKRITDLEEKNCHLQTQNMELDDENATKMERIDELEKKINELTHKLDTNEEKYKELMNSTQKKLLGTEKLQKELKIIIMKKNFLINAFKSDIAKNSKDGILLNKIRKSEAKITQIMKEKFENLAVH